MVPGFLQPERVPFVDVQIVRAGDPDDRGVQMFERLARDPGASVEKIERLMALWERSETRKAEAAFNEAMSTAQKAMTPVRTDAENLLTKSRYASYVALDRALRPLYTAHGFGLSFDTGECPLPDAVRVLCYVTHQGGGSRTYRLDLPADGKGAKGGDVMTKTHATGSALSYGMRYLLKMIFNIAVGEADDDGNAATVKAVRTATPIAHPSGYLQWLDTLRQAAQLGTATLERAWYDGPKAFRQHLTTTNVALRNELKAIAARQIAGAAS